MSAYPDLSTLLLRVPCGQRARLREFWETAMAEHAEIEAAHQALVAEASGLRAAVLRLHAPVLTGSAKT